MKKIIILTVLAFFGCKAAEIPQERSLTGIVTDESAEPVPFVTVTVKGTKRVAQTDFDGKYSIKVSKGETLRFSSVGYQNAEYKIENQPTLNIRLNSSVTLLESMGPDISRKEPVPYITPVTAKQIAFDDNPNSMFKKDLAENQLQLYMGSGWAGPQNPEKNKVFQEKYGIMYHDFGCTILNSEVYTKYNILVFRELRKKFGTAWESEINPQVLGWEKWKKSKK